MSPSLLQRHRDVVTGAVKRTRPFIRSTVLFLLSRNSRAASTGRAPFLFFGFFDLPRHSTLLQVVE